MKIAITSALVAAMFAAPAYAFDLGDRNTNTNVNTNTNANYNANANVNSNRNNNWNSNRNQATSSARSNSAQDQAQRQTQANSQSTVIQDRLQAVPASAPSMSSGHPCQRSGVSFGLGLIGGGASVGAGGPVDDACMLAQMGYKDAAMVMIAQRSEAARQALQATGHVRAAPTANVSSRSAPKAQTVAYRSCVREGNNLRVKVKAGADKATAIAQCRAAVR